MTGSDTEMILVLLVSFIDFLGEGLAAFVRCSPASSQTCSFAWDLVSVDKRLSVFIAQLRAGWDLYPINRPDNKNPAKEKPEAGSLVKIPSAGRQRPKPMTSSKCNASREDWVCLALISLNSRHSRTSL